MLLFRRIVQICVELFVGNHKRLHSSLSFSLSKINRQFIAFQSPMSETTKQQHYCNISLSHFLSGMHEQNKIEDNKKCGKRMNES